MFSKFTNKTRNARLISKKNKKKTNQKLLKAMRQMTKKTSVNIQSNSSE